MNLTNYAFSLIEQIAIEMLKKKPDLDKLQNIKNIANALQNLIILENDDATEEPN